jgi:hypothetical protein
VKRRLALAALGVFVTIGYVLTAEYQACRYEGNLG